MERPMGAWPDPFKPICYYSKETDTAHVCLSESEIKSQSFPFVGLTVDHDDTGKAIGFHLGGMRERVRECQTT